jgi:hypothetical protein
LVLVSEALSSTPSCHPFCSTLGHFIYECKSTRPYVSRPSRTQQLENPGVLAKLKSEGKPSVEVPEEFKKKCVAYSIANDYALNFGIRTGTANQILEAKEKEREKEENQDQDQDQNKKRSRRFVVILISYDSPN